MSQEIIEREIRLGVQASIAYESFVKDFIYKKREQLISEFLNLPISGDCLVDILDKRKMYSLLQEIENEIKSIIQTGELAKKSLKD